MSSSSSSRSVSPASPPLREAQSSPIKSSPPALRTPASSPFQEPESSPVKSSPPRASLSSSSTENSPPEKRKRYEFHEPEVPLRLAYWPDPAPHHDDLSQEANQSLMPTEAPAPFVTDLGNGEDNLQLCEPANDGISDLNVTAACNPQCDHYISSDSCTSTVAVSDTSSSGTSISSSSDEEISDNENTVSDSDIASNTSEPGSSDNSRDEDESSVQNKSVMKVCEGGNLTVDEGVLVLMGLFMKHKLKKEVFSDLLQGLLRFLPPGNNMPKSKHLLFKYIEDLCPLSPEKVHFYCKKCKFYLGEESVNCTLCGSECNKFFQLPLADQIRSLFEIHNLADIIDKYAEERRNKDADDSYSDVCDGLEYKRAHLPGMYSLTLLGHTDGVSISESSLVTFWPLEYVICELPPHLRFKYVLICGVWLDSSKPYMNSYLKPFVEELTQIFDQGIHWIHPKTKEERTTFIVAPVFCADAPVRAQLQNILTHGGKYCCHNCEQKTVKLPPQPVLPGVKHKKRKRVFTLQENASELRTAQRMKVQGETSRERQRQARSNKLIAHKGVRGRSVISKIPKCDRSSVVYPEYMHVLLGIIKQFMTLWFETSNTDSWSLKEHRDKINSFLVSIRVPDYVTRIPRSTDCFSMWKANEVRSFLLYFSLVILSEFMTDEYLQHWILFVSGMYTLLQETISESDIKRAEIMLKMFLRDFSKLYRAEDFSYNLHNLGHFGLTTRRWGPLWSNSAFAFESVNGALSQCIHGTKNQAKELINTLKLFRGVQVLKARVDIASSDPIANTRRNVTELRNRCKRFSFKASQDLLLSSSNIKKPVSVYYRAVIRGEIFTSNNYSRQEKRNNYTICYISSTGRKEYGEISCFCEGCDTDVKLAFVNSFVIEHLRMFSHSESGVVVKHIIPVRESSTFQLIPLENICFKVIRVGNFVCIRPNKHEVNL